jgi:membrane-associated protease RseP (regulator of RpoE activity)
MKPPIPDKRSLIDIGASGPIGGFIIAIIASVIGLSLSEVRPAGTFEGGLAFGSSLLFSFLSEIVLQTGPEEFDVMLHPVAFAGWIGLLVTSLNLLPIGQLDGGHIVYALFGEKHQLIAKITIPILIVMGITLWPGWIVWAILMLIMGYKHPPVVYPHIQLDKSRKFIGWISLAIFILTFTPMPVQGF